MATKIQKKGMEGPKATIAEWEILLCCEVGIIKF